MRHTIPTQTTLDAAGAGVAAFTARYPLAVFHTRVQVAPVAGAQKVVKRARALLYLNGVEFESTNSGVNDQSDSAYDLDPGDSIECRWTGGDPGAVATLIVRGNS